MVLTIGRATLAGPNEIRRIRRRSKSMVEGAQGLSYPSTTTRTTKEYSLRGRDQGTSVDANQGIDRADKLEREGGRWGSVYVTDTFTQVPEGYYELGDVEVENPSGRPKGRRWTFTLSQQPIPNIARQAEDDNIAGADTADVDAEEESKVAYTPTVSEVVVLQPRIVAGAEKLNLPKGSWRLVARVYANTTTTVKFRGRLTNIAGATIDDGAQLGPTIVNGWQEVDLGVFTVVSADHKANWYEVLVQDPTNTNPVWIDRIYIVSSVGAEGGAIPGGVAGPSVAEAEVGF